MGDCGFRLDDQTATLSLNATMKEYAAGSKCSSAQLEEGR